MPRCGSQCYLCDLPIRFDTYIGCSHACRYCFAQKKQDITNIRKGEGVDGLKRFIAGERAAETRWCDWDIPLHWGVMSDPLQPIEKEIGLSYKCLKVFEQTQYPFIISTKGALAGEEKYIEILEKCNCVVQISAVCGKYDKIEKGCPSYAERVEIMRKLSGRVKRVICRIQPYMHEVYDDVFENLKILSDAGVYGVIIEGMKYAKKKKGLVRVGGDYCYPYKTIREDFEKLKEEGHKNGLKVYAGENRIRELGDSLTCCGIDGLEGFVPNRFNLNHLLNGDEIIPTEKQKEGGTGSCFKTLCMEAGASQRISKNSFANSMITYYRYHRKTVDEVFGKGRK